MSCFTKLTLLLAVFTFVLTAQAQRHTFDTSSRGIKAQFNVQTESNQWASPDIRLELSIPALDMDRMTDGFDKIQLKGLFPLNQPGKPDLYTTGTLIAVPQGWKPQLHVEQMETTQIADAFVAPFQKKFRCAGMLDTFHFDSALYKTNAVFPQQVISLKEVGKLQSLKLIRVAIHPMQLNPQTRTLLVTHKLSARVSLVQTELDAGPIHLSPTLFSIAQAATANGKHLDQWVTRKDDPEVMLVFTADAFKSTIQPLVAWKRAKGLNVEVKTLSEAGGTREAVQQYIQDYYDAAQVKPTYLLFVGNKTSMPAFYESTGSGSAISDYRMALLTGSDAIPDALYGRIVADTEAEVLLQMDRMMKYERNPSVGNWYPKALTIASNEGYNPSDAEYAGMVADSLLANTYIHVDDLLNGENTATPENVSQGINDGRSWVAYFGHGSGTSWGSTNGSYSNSNVDALDNADRLPVVIDVACMNGNWGSISRCFGKAWVTGNNNGNHTGAVAFYGGSVNISWHPPAVMSTGVAKYHFEMPVYHLGGSVLAGQLFLVEKMGTGSNVIDNIKWYNLFGDPSLLIRTDIPKSYTLYHQVKKTIHGVKVEVIAKDTAGNAVVGMTTSLNNAKGTRLALGKTDENGTVSLTVSGLTQLGPDTLLTTTGYNLETQQINVQ